MANIQAAFFMSPPLQNPQCTASLKASPPRATGKNCRMSVSMGRDLPAYPQMAAHLPLLPC
jgi:hypothetical protein